MTSHVKIINKVVHGGPALKVHGYISYGQYIIDKLKERCERGEGDHTAMINGATGQKTTYITILQKIVDVGAGLRKIGIKRGDVVAICSENRDEFLPVAIGAMCCGATITTLNPQYTKDEMIHILNISKPNIIFCSEEALKANYKKLRSISFNRKIIQLDGTPMAKNVIPFSSIATINTNIEEYEAEDVEGWSDVGFILYSSGTTGMPKGVMLSHLNLLYAAASFENEINGVERQNGDDVLLTLVPWYHAYGLMSTVNYVAVGKRLVYFAGFDPLKYLNAIQEYKVTVILAVPPLVVFFAKVPFLEEFDMSSVTSVWCGAAPLNADIISQAMKRLPNCKGIYQAYGMTETSLAATKDTDEEGVTPKPGSGGMPLRGVKAKVVDIVTRQKLGPNQEGEICLKGPIIMKGYCGDKAATRNILDEEGYLKTGDIGFYDKDGCFFVVDRLKELIKYKGNQVPPAVVETVLLQHEAVAECGVVGAPDDTAGELPTAFVVLKDDGATATEKDILDFANNLLSPEKRLYGGVIFVNEIPKNPSGKILRRVLKQKLQAMRKKSKL